MENIIYFILINLILDLSCLIILKNYFRLSVMRFELLAVLSFGIIPSLVFIFLELKLFVFILAKMVYLLLASLLMTNLYKFKCVMILFFSAVVIELSCFGFYEFILLFADAVMEYFSGSGFNFYGKTIIAVLLFLYIFAQWKLFESLSYKKTIKSFLSKVSFSFFGKHIELTGLLDSGNYLYDYKLGKFVIVVEKQALKKFLSKSDYKKLIADEFDYFGKNHKIRYCTSSEKDASMPVFDVGKVKIYTDKEIKIFDAGIGLTGQKLSKSSEFECLISREFM